MFGWSISASACRSASNRASTCLRVHPGLMSFTATSRWTGSVCSASQTAPMPPSPICSQQLVPAGDHRAAAARPRTASAVAPAAGRRAVARRRPAGRSRKLPAWSWAASRASTRRRRAASPPHAAVEERRPGRPGRAGRRRRGTRLSTRSGSAGMAASSGVRHPSVRDRAGTSGGCRNDARGIAGSAERRRRSQARAYAQCAVGGRAGDARAAAAASSTDSPAKKRSLTSRAAGGSSAASRVRASSRASRSSGRRSAAGVGRSRSTRPPAAAALQPALAAGVLDEDAAHGLGGGGEEVARGRPSPGRSAADQPQVRLVDQGGRLEGLARASRRPAGRRRASAARRRRAGAGRRRPAGRRPRRRPGGG